jgi:pimeloyl-ACP methyl ester carboxylesterase
MTSGRVVEPLDVVERICSGLVPGAVDLSSDALGFQRREEAFHGSIVPDLAGSSHAACDAAVAVQAPDLVRKLILVGTGPRGADTAASKSGEIFPASYDQPEHLWIAAHFLPNATGRAAGPKYLERKFRRQDRVPEVSEASANAQYAAIVKSNEKTDGVWDYLADIHQPVLVVDGSNDLIIPTTLQQHLPNAQLIVYPDSSHAPFYQYT